MRDRTWWAALAAISRTTTHVFFPPPFLPRRIGQALFAVATWNSGFLFGSLVHSTAQHTAKRVYLEKFPTTAVVVVQESRGVHRDLALLQPTQLLRHDS